MHEYITMVSDFVLWSVAYLLTFKTIVLVMFSFMHFSKSVYNDKFDGLVSFIVPCYDEELTLGNCIDSILNQDYKKYEIIIIDDGSKDNTLSVAKQYENDHDNIRVYAKTNGGKASALNYGIEKANGEIIISMDADTIFLKDTLIKLLNPFCDESICAVCGNVRISNRSNILTKLQSLEYISGLNIQRRTFAYIGCMQIISGAIGAFRKEHVKSIGGYSTDTIVEDMDITVTFGKAGYRTEYIGDAIAYTEAPENITDFYKQRYRWIFGGFEVLKKHTCIDKNTMSIIGLPYIIGSLLIDMAVTLVITVLVSAVVVYNYEYNLLALLVLIITLQSILFLYSVTMDRENKKHIALTPLYILLYLPFINIITCVCLFNFVMKNKTSWNKVKRLGKNTVV